MDAAGKFSTISGCGSGVSDFGGVAAQAESRTHPMPILINLNTLLQWFVPRVYTDFTALPNYSGRM
ncbi:hypothetical protein IMCC3088_2374 [Aequoribacter fuscus]|uniref:Uncharacterized protein n=1 Tax=Aequoribacter fuscus TaxID=2518989 RepID=F3L3Z3_9GAMM|nr:hypothetical protein IMCC3088_2374 [Aequoribacter fuscus]